jgi:hypothetical protein
MMTTISVAESCTGGLLANSFVSVSGASRYFEGGIVCYNIDQKCRHLGVDRDEAARCDCVSEGVARQMARGCAHLFGTRFAVSTTGFAEPRRESISLSLSCSSDDVVNFVTHPPVAFVSIYDNLQDSYIDIQVEHDGIMDRNAFRQYIVDVAKNKLLDTDIVSRPAAVVPCHESGGYGHRPSSGTRGG